MLNNPQSSQAKTNLQKMINDYTEMKSRLIHTSALLKAEIQEKSNYLEKNQVMAIQNKTLEEENNTLKANYEAIQKRYEQLQKELNEAKASKKRISYMSYFTGSNKNEENNELQSRIGVLENELEIKIKENEECHVEVFEYKKQFNDKVIEFDNKTEKYKTVIQEKNNELDKLTNTTNLMINEKQTIENQLIQLNKNYDDLSNDYNMKRIEYQTNTAQLNKQLELMNIKAKEYFPINLYANEEFIPYDIDYIYSNRKMRELERKQLDCINDILLKGMLKLFSEEIEKLIGSLNKRVTMLNFNDSDNNWNNISIVYDNLNGNFITLQEYSRVSALFLKMIIDELGLYSNSGLKPENINNIMIMRNILLVLMKKIMMKFDSIGEVLIQTIQQKNIEIVKAINEFNEQFRRLLKKVLLFLNYNEEYNDEHISIETDNYYHLTIKVSKDYNINYQRKEMNQGSSSNIQLLKDIFEINITQFKFSLDSLISICFTHNMQELMLPNCSSSLNQLKIKQNNDLIQSSCNGISNIIQSILQIKDSINDIFTTQTSFNNQTMVIVLSNLYLTKTKYENWNYQTEANEITYKEAIKWKQELEELKQNDFIYKEDKALNERRIEEYEEQVNKLKNMLLNEQNAHDLLKTKINSKQQPIGDDSSTINTISVSDKVSDFEDFINPKKTIMDNEYSIFDEGVLSGERLSIKIDTETINNFKEVIDQNTIGLLYHRKVIEKLKRYVIKVKNIDLKYMNQEEMKLEYENKIKEYTINEKVLKDTNQENVDILTNLFIKYEDLKSMLCTNCKKYIKNDD